MDSRLLLYPVLKLALRLVAAKVGLLSLDPSLASLGMEPSPARSFSKPSLQRLLISHSSRPHTMVGCGWLGAVTVSI